MSPSQTRGDGASMSPMCWQPPFFPLPPTPPASALGRPHSYRTFSPLVQTALPSAPLLSAPCRSFCHSAPTCQLFSSGKGEKNSRRVNAGAWGPTRERTPLALPAPPTPTPTLRCLQKGTLAIQGKVPERALIAEPGDKHDYQLRVLSQKVS